MISERVQAVIANMQANTGLVRDTSRVPEVIADTDDIQAWNDFVNGWNAAWAGCNPRARSTRSEAFYEGFAAGLLDVEWLTRHGRLQREAVAA